MNNFKEFIEQPTTDIAAQFKSGQSEVYENSFNYFTTPKFRAGQTGCSRRDINVWRKEDLLPSNLEENKWNQFSIAECVWLRFLGMLKKFGVKQELILKIKKEMFPDDVDTLRNSILAIKGYPDLPKEFDNVITEIIEEFDKDPDETLSDIKDVNYSAWANIIMLCCKLHMNFAAVINEDGNYLFMNIGKPGKPLTETAANLPELILKELSNQSFLLINIYELCKDFFENEKVLIDSNYYFGLMTNKEQEVITELRSGNYKMVTLKLEDGSITHIKLTKKDSENEAMLRKLSRLFKTNDFKDIELTTRNGKIIKYTETDIIKLNKK